METQIVYKRRPDKKTGESSTVELVLVGVDRYQVIGTEIYYTQAAISSLLNSGQWV